MKGYIAASSPPAKRRWKGHAVAVLALVFFSLLVPLAFLLGLHNRFPSGYLSDERSSSESVFENYARVDAGQEQNQSEEQLDDLGSQGPDTSGPDDYLSRVLGPEHSGRVRCRPGQTPTGYWSGASSSSSSHVSGGPITQEQLDSAIARADRARQDAAQADQRASQADQRAYQAQQDAAQAQRRSSQLQDVMTAMVTQLSTTLGDDFSRFRDMLASFDPPAPSAAPGPTAAAPDPAAAPGPDDREEEDEDLGFF